MKKNLLFIFFILLISSALSAEKITVPYVGFVTPSPQPVYIDIEWNEDIFFTTDSFTYNHEISRAACLLSGASYNYYSIHETPQTLKEILKCFGFRDENITFLYNDFYQKNKRENRASITLAYKERNDIPEQKLLIIIVRGTPFDINEWISNININDSKTDDLTYEGIRTATDYAEKNIKAFIKENNIDLNTTSVLLTGHSRGASIANLLGEHISRIEGLDSHKIFTYTYGASNITMSNDVDDEKFGFIWNIESTEDITHYFLPNQGNWHYRKYGNIRMMQNSWSSSQYETQFLPKINEIYRKFYNRDFRPFRHGPFIPIQLVNLTTTLCHDPKMYNKLFFGFRHKFELILKMIFFKKENHYPQKQFEKLAKSLIEKSSGKSYDILFEYFVDMHCCEAYLSQLLALSEEELFTTQDYTQISLNGNFDGLILNEKKEISGTITNGYADMRSFHAPEGLFSFPNSTKIGLPPFEDYTIMLKTKSVLPNPVVFRIEKYDAYGNFLSNSNIQTTLMHSGKVIVVNAKNFQSSGRLTFDTITDKEALKIKNSKKLFNERSFRLGTEFSINFRKNPEVGINFGNSLIYGKLNYSFNILNGMKSPSFLTGIGHETDLIYRFYISQEATGRFIWPEHTDYKSSDPFVFIPSYRFNIMYKPVKHFEFMLGAEILFSIKNFNASFFDYGFHHKDFNHLSIKNTLELHPDIRLGLRWF